MPYDERLAANIPSVHHEFPTGYHQDFGSERFKLAEGLFDHAMLGAGYIGNEKLCILKFPPETYCFQPPPALVCVTSMCDRRCIVPLF